MAPRPFALIRAQLARTATSACALAPLLCSCELPTTCELGAHLLSSIAHQAPDSNAATLDHSWQPQHPEPSDHNSSIRFTHARIYNITIQRDVGSRGNRHQGSSDLVLDQGGLVPIQVLAILHLKGGW
eukprot:m.226374 g.226374  ORF g.226374 m.226374 type:complete len:128 (-) comp25928_c2_seq1:1236-1619(-)